MTECVILMRMDSGRVQFVFDQNEVDICVFKDRDEAQEYVDKNRLLQSIPYQIVELDEI
jgi:septin family protein